jgi:TonB family protein
MQQGLQEGTSTMRRILFLTLAAAGMAALVAMPVSAQWLTSVSTDEMTRKRTHFASSPRTASTRPMGFPYNATRAWLGVGCGGEERWAYIGFNESPNLTNTTTESGYNAFSTRVRWDDNVETMRFRQEWGASFIHFDADEEAIARMVAASTVLLELQWYGEGSTYFEFSLRGSSAALAEAGATCVGPDRAPPPEEATTDISAAPTFTPYTVAPSILNRGDVMRSMEREYPPLLRDAGIGGTVTVYFFIDEDGLVQDRQINDSSGHQALDDAAMVVSEIYRFSPALNRDKKVPVWVSFSITFQVR